MMPILHIAYTRLMRYSFHGSSTFTHAPIWRNWWDAMPHRTRSFHNPPIYYSSQINPIQCRSLKITVYKRHVYWWQKPPHDASWMELPALSTGKQTFGLEQSVWDIYKELFCSPRANDFGCRKIMPIWAGGENPVYVITFPSSASVPWAFETYTYYATSVSFTASQQGYSYEMIPGFPDMLSGLLPKGVMDFMAAPMRPRVGIRTRHQDNPYDWMVRHIRYAPKFSGRPTSYDWVTVPNSWASQYNAKLPKLNNLDLPYVAVGYDYTNAVLDVLSMLRDEGQIWKGTVSWSTNLVSDSKWITIGVS